MARCHRGGSPRTFQRAASSPRGAQATPHPGKRKRAAAARLAAPRRTAPRLALQQRTRTRTHAPALAPRERSNPPSEFRTGSQKGPGSNREPVRPPPLAVLAKASKAVLDITREIVRAREILTRPTVPSRQRSRAARARTRRPRALPPPPPSQAHRLI